MARRIVIASGKGGVGKTTVTANLGLAFASLGYRVVLIDLDFGLNNLDVTMGLENKILYDISDVATGKCRAKQALIEDKIRKNLFIMPSGTMHDGYLITGQQIKLIIENLSPTFDFVLIDCPAGIDLGFHRAISCADEALIVSTPSLTSLKDADKTIEVIKTYKLSSVNLVINRARGDLIMSNKMLMPVEIESLLKTNLIGVLPEEDVVFLSGGYAMPRKSDSYKAYKILANNIVNGNKKIFDVTNKYSGFFGSIRRGLKRSIWTTFNYKDLKMQLIVILKTLGKSLVVY